ncbi:MAG: hypothetical protein R2716_13490 [Microthrixaceae bacterium]
MACSCRSAAGLDPGLLLHGLLGLPGLAGFWGEFPAILAAYQPAPMLNEALFRTLMAGRGPRDRWLRLPSLGSTSAPRSAPPVRRPADDPEITDVSSVERISRAPMLLLIVVLGFLPSLIFDVIPATNLVVAAATGS